MKLSTHKFGYYTIIGCIVGIAGLITITYADLELLFTDLNQALVSSTFPISFGGGGNNFAGTLIVTAIESIPDNGQTTITYGSSTSPSLLCKKKIKGYYFNAARGAWTLPLDTSNNNLSSLSMSGGLYTACTPGPNNDIVGIISWGLRGNTNNLGTIVFGTNLTFANTEANSYTGTYKPGAVSRHSVTGGALKVNGKFFDSMLGIGAISSSYTSGVSYTDLIGAFNLINIQGHVGIGQSVESAEQNILTTSLAGTKTLLTSSDEVIASTVINTVSKNVAKKCRSTALDSLSSIPNKKFICFAGNNTIDSGNIDDLVNKDIVFMEGDVFIDASAYDTLQNNPLSLYVANGNLIFDNHITNLTPVDKNGFKISGPGQSQGLYLLGNYIVNGVVLGGNSISYTTIPFKTFIHGKFTSLNTFTTVSPQREKLLQALMTNRTPNYSTLSSGNNNIASYFEGGKWNASMENIFSWRCAERTMSTGGTSQTGGMGAIPRGSFPSGVVNLVQSIACPTAYDKYPLVIIERNIPTSFFLK